MPQITDDLAAVYRDVALHDRVLPVHRYRVPGTAEPVTDVELVARTLADLNPDSRRLDVLDLGCGAGRVTYALAPHAHAVTGVDPSPEMITAFSRAFPDARTLTTDAASAVRQLRSEAARFDVIGAFWSLNYPLGSFYERTTPDGVETVADLPAADRAARRFVDDLVDLLAPGGHLLVLYFDSESPEQRLVTRMWERLAAFPGTGRAHTRAVLTDRLHAAEEAGRGRLTALRLPGTVRAADAEAARAWMTDYHLAGHPQLRDDRKVGDAVDAFVAQHTVAPSGEVVIPSGVHLLHFRATDTGDPR
ncbi:class I SAM-dependent DNA methyltransferase [Streptodolium elevatio]|uniref:Class I SAM-dependent methyltransferase n=1 Tax=Streptodolium elevatio TaxID=3157996 RepID=A0ABV3DH02_9ACTN